jgi:hypothetical protein
VSRDIHQPSNHGAFWDCGEQPGEHSISDESEIAALLSVAAPEVKLALVLAL